MRPNHASMIAILAVLSGPAAQIAVNLTRQVKVESGVQLPAQCSEGQLLLKSAPNAREANGDWQALSSTGRTHMAADMTSGTFTADRLPSGVIFGTQANTYAAGDRQSVSHDASNPGLRLVPANGHPANAPDGDLWYNGTTGTFRWRQNGVVSDWGGSSQTVTATPAPNAIPVANSSGVLAQGWLPQPNATTLGGVEAFTAGGHEWTNSISAVASGAQPACADLSNASASCSIDATNASNISTGPLAASRLPAPTGITLGGVQTKDCSGLGHVQKINTDGTITCSADSGGSGGGTGLVLSAGAGEVCLWQPCYPVSTGGTATYATNSVYYFQTVIPYTINLKQYVGYVNPGTGSHHEPGPARLWRFRPVAAPQSRCLSVTDPKC